MEAFSHAPTVMLATGVEMPALGLGVYLVRDPAVCETSVETALRAGYRLVDTAAMYGNERAVGRGLKASGVPREDVFLTTKVWVTDFGYERTKASIAASLERLDSGWIDLMLLHQPVRDVLGSWRAMEEAVDAGTLRAIGISNFTVADTRRLLEHARIRPVLNQVELHPYFHQGALTPFLDEQGIVTQSWYPLGHGSKDLFQERVLVDAAAAHGRSVAQVILRWHVQRGLATIPKSTDPEHIVANLDVFDFSLTETEMAAIEALDKGRPMFRPPRWLLAVGTSLLRPRQLP
ncbi:aldo/keto reductase [Demequina capsici]|uniref:Aldo/keto reductase n=1 Tax=Demequina capsici TaxID=3075620 RepID=A0AA96FDS9_9MICO|nr:MULTISPECIES: aldo/keto reductase [unclassified Demequina]WNM24832.1 aldo/keto reductase [Demequina sp. OYTSA14]WNM27739.1 aldo/keto reductase [Demequina sp. PMTSA13]